MANIVFDFLHNYETGERRESEPANAYQYDEGHVLEAILPSAVTTVELHYWIRGMEEAEAYTPASITPNTDGSYTVLGNIPNKYFETNGELRVYIVVTDGDASITTYEGKLHICQRSMPDDYVDDDPENEATRVLTEAQAAATTATQQAQAASNSAGQAAQSAQTLSQSVAQIATNTQDISTLKEDLLVVQTDLSDAQTELEKKANTDGYYEDMTVGDAEQLVSSAYVDDSVPYNFRTTGGSADVGNREYVDAVVGGTVVLNQQVYNGNFASDTGWANLTGSTRNIANNECVLTITANWAGIQTDGSIDSNNKPTDIAGHKYFISADLKSSENTGNTVGFGVSHYGSGKPVRKTFSVTTSYATYSFIGTQTTETVPQNNVRFMVYDTAGGAGRTLYVKNVMCIDLTQMFGSTIADYIYSLEQATEGAGVAWFKKLFPKDYYEYNAGELLSVSGLASHDTVGFNQWDEEWEDGWLNTITGAKEENSMQLRTKNFIRILPNMKYFCKAPSAILYARLYFYDATESLILYRGTSEWLNREITTPSGACYMKFVLNKAEYGTTYKNDICINLSDPARNGEYEPYEKHTYPLDSSQTLRGILKLDGANKLYFDGDRYAPDGSVQRRYGEVDLGTLNWQTRYTGESKKMLSAVLSRPYILSDSRMMLSEKYDVNNGVAGAAALAKPDDFTNGMYWATTLDVNRNVIYQVCGKDDALPTGKFIYEFSTPTTESAEPYQQRQIIDADGTEEFVSTSIVPVGHKTRYAPNLRAKLEKSPDSPVSDGVYIVQRSGGVNAYVPLASSATIQDIINRLTALEGA